MVILPCRTARSRTRANSRITELAKMWDGVTTYWFDRISLEISYILCVILYLHVRYLDVYCSIVYIPDTFGYFRIRKLAKMSDRVTTYWFDRISLEISDLLWFSAIASCKTSRCILQYYIYPWYIRNISESGNLQRKVTNKVLTEYPSVKDIWQYMTFFVQIFKIITDLLP